MNHETPGEAGDRLTPDEIEMIRGCLGDPSGDRLERAIEGVEQQVALEDLVILIISGVGEAARCFLDFLAELNVAESETGNDLGPGVEES